MKPVQKEERYTLSHLVSEKLKQYIIENQIQPGQRLPAERELVKTLQVSRSVLREALRGLENLGILSIRHGEGAFVKTHDMSPLINQLMFHWKLDQKKTSDLFELRKIFELAAIDQIVQYAGEDDFNHLDVLATRMKKVKGDMLLTQEADIEFHLALIRATHNELFVQMTELLVQYFAQTPHHHMNELEIDKTTAEHAQIAAALRKRDSHEAKRVLQNHLEFSKKYVKLKSL